MGRRTKTSAALATLPALKTGEQLSPSSSTSDESRTIAAALAAQQGEQRKGEEGAGAPSIGLAGLPVPVVG